MSDQPTPEASLPDAVTPAPAVPGNAAPDDYPKMLYKPDGSTIVADSAPEHDSLAQDGWAQTPFPIHQQPQITQSPALSANDPLALMVRAVIEAVLDDRGITAQWVQGFSPGNTDPNAMQMPPMRSA